jgi:hypothetical protein
MKISLFTWVSSIALAVALSGCGGGGGINSAPASVPAGASPSNSATVTWKMQWASSTTTSISGRQPLYLARTARSASIATITANGAGSTEIQYLNAPKTTLTFSAPNGLDTFQIKTYDEQNGQGNVLSVADVTQTITSTTANVVSATLNGVIASLRTTIAYASGTTSFQVGTSGSATVTVKRTTRTVMPSLSPAARAITIRRFISLSQRRFRQIPVR